MNERISLNGKATLLGSLAIFFWGLTLPISKFVAKDLGQFTTVGLCLLFGGMIYRLVLGRPKPIQEPKLLLLRFALYFTYFLTLHAALSATKPEALPVVILANYIWPIATIIWSKLLVHSKISGKLYFSLFLVFVALVIEKGGAELLNAPKPELIWFLVALFAANMWGIYSALNKNLSTRWGDFSHLSILASISGVLLVTLGTVRGEPQNMNFGALLPFVIYTLCTITGQFLWDYGTRRGNIVILGFVADLTPWISLMTASVIFNTPISLSVYGAALLILMAAWIARRE